MFVVLGVVLVCYYVQEDLNDAIKLGPIIIQNSEKVVHQVFKVLVYDILVVTFRHVVFVKVEFHLLLIVFKFNPGCVVTGVFEPFYGLFRCILAESICWSGAPKKALFLVNQGF